ncbi:alpha-L-fucosidase [Faunimonas pinastri]|uniref:alpha-L-fucosidase n=1 Tax=Faunimonas pinastri TaxID=1855383 RepID=A0A1H9QT04_9HYPH|nr:alpha-L-fucosidase [Faunimonas pinastri]SER63570.1 alpha-L-fucosidase [Faunimonas pinastri]
MNTITPGLAALPAEKKQWFVEDRFGMFIHWGLYSLPARHEWVKNREEISTEDYQKYFDHFDPDLYDPAEWAKMARAAGMKYVVLTTKHHEGFCLWDSAVTDYKVTETPYGKDLLGPFVEAFRAEGLKVGFYYSLIDWHHPDFPVDPFHPQRNDPEAARMNEGRDISRYASYMRDQVRELLTGFGKIDVIWFDFSYPNRLHNELPGKGHKDWQSEELVKLVRDLQPEIIINNRLDLVDLPADVTTPEQYVPREWPKVKGENVTWEACHTLSGSWGYHRDEDTWKSPDQLIRLLVDTVSMGGNLLMNVGPTGRGLLDDRAVSALDVYGKWMKLNGRSIYGCTQSSLEAPQDCRLTQRGNRLYVHLFSWPFRHLHLDGLAGKVRYAQFLHDASEVLIVPADEEDPWNPTQVKVAPTSVTLELPVRKPDVLVPVIELFLED